ncbi:MAG: zinc-ribbon domain-containing protein [Archangium sp.]
MEIACPQCSMQYALDPRLLPSGGVPVQCTRCSHVFIAAPPAPAAREAQAPTRPSPPPNPNPPLNNTLIYGAGKTSTQPSAMTTQIFGAASQVPQVPPMAPVANRPQPAPAGKPPSAMTTQIFGAAPQVPQVPPVANKPPPAANKPPAGAAPAAMTTQVFGTGPQPSAAPAGQVPQPARPPSALTTPPFGSVSQETPITRAPAGAAPTPAGTPPSAFTTQLFGNAPATGPQAAGARGPQPGQASVPTSQPPGLAPRATTQDKLPAVQAPSEHARVFGVAATTPIELPEEILVQLNRPLSELMGEEASSEERPSSPGPSGPALSKPLELSPELLNDVAQRANGTGRDKRPGSGGKGRGLLIAGGVLVLALTAFLTSPAWRSKSNALPHEVLVAKDEALALLRRDDAASKEEALSRLKALSAARPQSAELLAEVGVALAMHLDDTQVRAVTLQAKVKRLQSRIHGLTQAQTPADWQSRVNTMRDELATLQKELTPLEERGAALSKEAVQVLKRLEVAPETEPREAALARIRGRALLSSALGGADALGLAVQLAQAELRDWSTLTMAEYVLHYATPSETQVRETASALERLRETDKTFLRTYVLGARIALMRKDPAAAQGLLDTVITLNPKHELAQQLQGYARELASHEPEPTPAPAPEATPTP